MIEKPILAVLVRLELSLELMIKDTKKKPAI